MVRRLARRFRRRRGAGPAPRPSQWARAIATGVMFNQRVLAPQLSLQSPNSRSDEERWSDEEPSLALPDGYHHDAKVARGPTRGPSRSCVRESIATESWENSGLSWTRAGTPAVRLARLQSEIEYVSIAPDWRTTARALSAAGTQLGYPRQWEGCLGCFTWNARRGRRG